MVSRVSDEAASPRPGERLLELVAVMDRLRSPGGCAWDARQTHASLVEYLVEEAYETVEAIETGDAAALREELGDLLLQVVFHARIAAEEDGFDIDDVADGIVAKLVERHPHVFGPEAERTQQADAGEAQWHARKARAKGRDSVVDGIPGSLPALVLAGKVLSRAGSLAPEPPRIGDAQALLVDGDDEAFGDLLLALVVAGRSRGLDAESSLRGAVRRLVADVRTAERTA